MRYKNRWNWWSMEVAEKLFQMPGATPERSLIPVTGSGGEVHWAIEGIKGRICKNPLHLPQNIAQHYFEFSCLVNYLTNWKEATILTLCIRSQTKFHTLFIIILSGKYRRIFVIQSQQARSVPALFCPHGNSLNLLNLLKVSAHTRIYLIIHLFGQLWD